MTAKIDAARTMRLPAPLPEFGLTVALVAGALGLTILWQSTVPTTGFIFLYASVVAASWFGGKWAGCLAVILSTLVVEYFFVPPIHSFAIQREFLPVFVEFAISAAVIGWFSSWRKEAEVVLKRARSELSMRVEERTAELRQSNEQLKAEMAERRRAEEAWHVARAELARVTRMSALGQLAASISHEVNQPLAAVVTNADACALWLEADPPNLEEVRAAVDSIVREGTRASEVVRRIRAMFTRAAPQRTPVEMNELIREASTLLETEIAKNQVVLSVELADDLPAILADRVQLQQVMVNLMVNAMEAMNGVTDRPHTLAIRTRIESTSEVLVSVRDSGIGIDSTNQRRIFDAFFTTKPQGMGMGLSISHSVIEAHGGRLWAASNGDHGATFQFTLPVDGTQSQ
jgi:C4-dicarboxylate-specific signal transduction histidine kinase